MDGINEDGPFINKTLTGKNGTIKANCIDLPPFTYLDENGELTGLEIETLYKLARKYGYQLSIELKEVSLEEEIYNSIKNGSFLIQDRCFSIF